MSSVALIRALQSTRSTTMERQNFEVDILGGPVAPTSKPMSALRDDVVKGEADAHRSGNSRHVQEVNAARLIQAYARRFLYRRRYLRHRHNVQQDLAALGVRRQRLASILIQKLYRGYAQRNRFYKLWFLDEEKRKEDAAKKGKKGGGAAKKGVPVVPPPVDLSLVPLPSKEVLAACRSAAMLRNGNFVSAVRQLSDEKYDEALATIEAYMKTAGASIDPVSSRLQLSVQQRKNISMGLAPNAVAPNATGAGAAGGAAAKKKK